MVVVPGGEIVGSGLGQSEFAIDSKCMILVVTFTLFTLRMEFCDLGVAGRFVGNPKN